MALSAARVPHPISDLALSSARLPGSHFHAYFLVMRSDSVYSVYKLRGHILSIVQSAVLANILRDSPIMEEFMAKNGVART